MDAERQAGWGEGGMRWRAEVAVTDDGEIDHGVAGGSALREYRRRHAQREERIHRRWGHLAGLVLALSEDPQSTRAWERGSKGETKLARSLARLDRDDVVVLHDRSVPGRTANIDHIVVCPSGVLVIDAKLYRGQVHVKDVGGLFGDRDLRLYVESRHCTRLAQGMGWQVDAVRDALEGVAIQVSPVLCFVDGEWPLLGGPREFMGVFIESEPSLRRLVSRPGDLDVAEVREVAMVLAHKLPAR